MLTECDPDQLFLVSQCRYLKPISDDLRPFGSPTQMMNCYSQYASEIQFILDQYRDVPDAHIVGTSQRGVYFRVLSAKQILEKLYPDVQITIRDEDGFTIDRSFLFRLEDVLTHVKKVHEQEKIHNIPLLWYSTANNYGYEPGRMCLDGLLHKHEQDDEFTAYVRERYVKDCEHEVVLRIPLPLSICCAIVRSRLNF